MLPGVPEATELDLWFWTALDLVHHSKATKHIQGQSEQTAFSRQIVCSWQSFLTVHWRGNKFAAALVKMLTASSIVASCWPLLFSNSCLCHRSLKLCMNFYTFIRITACRMVIACCMVFLEEYRGPSGVRRRNAMNSFYLHTLGFVFCPWHVVCVSNACVSLPLG